jgi:hypothetical protein
MALIETAKGRQERFEPFSYRSCRYSDDIAAARRAVECAFKTPVEEYPRVVL